jgi:sugar-specific transcriptional regulator TrmB
MLEQKEQLKESLCKLGLSEYQAKVFTALANLGPSGVSEIQRTSGVPRTKIYEILEQLVEMGAVQFQSGRPVIYDVLSPELFVDRMRDSYTTAANDATRLLTETSQLGRNTSDDLAWTVKGDVAIRQKASLTLASAKTSILVVEHYPPKLIRSLGAILRAAIKKKIKVRAVCVLQIGLHLEKRPGEDFIEYRRVSPRLLDSNNDDFFAEFRMPLLSIMHGASCLMIIDDKEAFNVFRGSGESRNIGINLKVPGLPLMQRVLFGKVIEQATSRAR